MSLKKHEERVAKLARGIANTGRHNGWFYVACELREKGEPLALQILEKEPLRSEIDQTCDKNRPKWIAEKRKAEAKERR